jgi:hypothetical protein
MGYRKLFAPDLCRFHKHFPRAIVTMKRFVTICMIAYGPKSRAFPKRPAAALVHSRTVHLAFTQKSAMMRPS